MAWTTSLLPARTDAGALAGTDRFPVTQGDSIIKDAPLSAMLTFVQGQAPRVLSHSAVASSVTGTTSETALATITVAANSIGANGYLQIFAAWSIPNNANSKTMRVRFGGLSGTAFYAPAALTTNASLVAQVNIANRNATNSQVSGPAVLAGGFGTSTGLVTTGTLATTSAQDIVITGQLGNSGDTITLERYTVLICYGA